MQFIHSCYNATISDQNVSNNYDSKHSNYKILEIRLVGHTAIATCSIISPILNKTTQKNMVSWCLKSLFSTNMAISDSETKNQGRMGGELSIPSKRRPEII